MDSRLTLSLITAEKPTSLSKSFSLSADGSLQKWSGGQLASGQVKRLDLTVDGFRELLKSAGPGQAVTFGIPEYEHARIVPLDKLNGSDTDPPTIARARSYFTWPGGAGVMMLDYDPAPGQPPLTRDQLLKALYGVWPDIRNSPHIWTASASSCIRRDDGTELRGICGQRVYVPVTNAADIPRCGNTLFQRLWLAGFGFYIVSASGALLDRGLIDASVWQPERLDFCGGAKCGRGLKQLRPDPLLFNADASFTDSTTLADLTAEELSTIDGMKREARAALKDKVAEQQEKWISSRLVEAVKQLPKNKQPAETERLRENYRRAIESKRLFGDFLLYSKEYGKVKVAEVLNCPDKFHGARFADPLEPEYGNDPRIAVANLKSASGPCIYSHAHGGQSYSLHKEVETIRIKGGQLHQIVDQILEVMHEDYRVYDRGELTRISDGQLFPVTSGWLSIYLNGLLHFEKWDARKKEWVPVDCPDALSKKITELAGEWGLPKLNGLITAPTITLTGRVIEENGFDSGSGLYLEFPDAVSWEGVCECPSENTLREALRKLWYPFEEFPFETPTDAGVHLATLFNAVVRQMLPQAPATSYNAPAAGSGKTMLANCVSLLAGQEPTAYPPTESEEEMRKRLSTVARAGLRAVIIDNVVGTLRSASLCTFLTSKTYSDRVLGETTNMSVPTNFLLIFTGNNMGFFGDLNRRVLRCTIDPMCERPDKRRFNLHPPTYIKTHRLEMIHAVLTILRGFFAAGAPKPKSDMGDFCDWSNLVRGAVVWIGANGWLDVGDPADSTDLSYEQDDDTQRLNALLQAWRLSFGTKDGITAARAVKQANNEPGGDLYEAIKAVADSRGSLNSSRLGYWLRSHRRRFVENLRFVQAGFSHKVACWKVESFLQVKKGGDNGDRGDALYPRAKNASASLSNRLEKSPLYPPSPPPSEDIDTETMEERAAIIEFDGRLPRSEAEHISRTAVRLIDLNPKSEAHR